MHRLRLAVVVGLALALNACALMDAEDCAKADWAALGLQDANNGHGLSERFARRRALCEKAGQRVDGAAYERGYQEAQRRICTADRGRRDGAGGLRQAKVCMADAPGGQRPQRPYLEGFASGLEIFCAPRAAYEHARAGGGDPETCPAALAAGFAAGLRLGQESKRLRAQIDADEREAGELRKRLNDSKATAPEREAMQRRLGQIEGQTPLLRAQLQSIESTAEGLPR
jgi:hypothetical protein